MGPSGAAGEKGARGRRGKRVTYSKQVILIGLNDFLIGISGDLFRFTNDHSQIWRYFFALLFTTWPNQTFKWGWTCNMNKNVNNKKIVTSVFFNEQIIFSVIYRVYQKCGNSLLIFEINCIVIERLKKHKKNFLSYRVFRNYDMNHRYFFK